MQQEFTDQRSGAAENGTDQRSLGTGLTKVPRDDENLPDRLRRARAGRARAVAGALRARAGDLVLAGCCDLDAVRAESFRRDFGYGRAYTDPAAMLEAERLDAVVVVVPGGADRGGRLARARARACRCSSRSRPARRCRGRSPDRRRRAGARRAAPGRLQSPLRSARPRAAPADRGGGPPPASSLRDDARRAARPRLLDDAIHGLDAVRFLAGCDYAEARFRYRELPELGKGVANILVDASMTSGATAHLAFCPVAGVLVERATAHAHGHSLFLHVPMWSGVDSPGRLWHFAGGALVAELGGDAGGRRHRAFRVGRLLPRDGRLPRRARSGRAPSPSLRESRQSVEIAERIRQRARSTGPSGGGRQNGEAHEASRVRRGDRRGPGPGGARCSRRSSARRALSGSTPGG